MIVCFCFQAKEGIQNDKLPRDISKGNGYFSVIITKLLMHSLSYSEHALYTVEPLYKGHIGTR